MPNLQDTSKREASPHFLIDIASRIGIIEEYEIQIKRGVEL